MWGMPLEWERYWSEGLPNDLDGESVPKSSEEQEVGMVGLRMQDMASGMG